MTQLGLTAKAVNAVTKGEAEKKGENNKGDENKDYGLYKVIMASCHLAEINCQYNNPSFDSPCSEVCGTCAKLPTSPPPTMLPLCNCSGPLVPPKKPIPIQLQVTQDMHKVGQV